jgi:hypothetical protein
MIEYEDEEPKSSTSSTGLTEHTYYTLFIIDNFHITVGSITSMNSHNADTLLAQLQPNKAGTKCAPEIRNYCISFFFFSFVRVQ